MSEFGEERVPVGREPWKYEQTQPFWTKRITFNGAQAVAVFFKVTAVVMLIGGVITAAAVGTSHSYTGHKAGVVIDIIAGTVFTAASVAFFGYVLELLLGIERNTAAGRPERIGPISSSDDPVTRWLQNPRS
jgi:hypothetical protein